MVSAEKNKRQKLNKWAKFAVFLTALVLINFLAQLVYTRWDFTKEKRFTLSQKTKDILIDNRHEVIVTVFFRWRYARRF